MHLRVTVLFAEQVTRVAAHLDSHDNTTGHMFHLVHDPVRSPAQLLNLLQVIGLHHKVLHSEEDALNVCVQETEQRVPEEYGAIFT